MIYRLRRKTSYFTILKYVDLIKKKNFLLCSLKTYKSNYNITILKYTNPQKENLLLSQKYKIIFKI